MRPVCCVLVLALTGSWTALCKKTEYELDSFNAVNPKKEEIVECGVTVADKIVGGTVAGRLQHPWLAFIRTTFSNSRMDIISSCSGSLIDNGHVITAAHCFFMEEFTLSHVEVRLGEYNTTSTNEGTRDFQRLYEGRIWYADAAEKRSATWQIHPDYKPESTSRVNYDVALLTLDQQVTYTPFIKPLCLPNQHLATMDFVGKTLTIAGWGATDTADGMFVASDVKRVVNLPVVLGGRCSADQSVKSNVSLTLCAGGGQGKDTCIGDSGGPFMYVDPEQVKYVLIGVLSRGPVQCGQRDRPGTYVRLAHVLPWLKEHGVTIP